jgi:hypothetical protein
MVNVAGEFNDRARGAIYEIGQRRCIGCGRSDITAQHRRPRGMGGTSNVVIGHPANGVPLCGDGVRGCHGWAESNREDARLLGWLLTPDEDALGTPFWSRGWQWRTWIEEEDGCPMVAYVDVEEDLDRAEIRAAAVARFQIARPEPTPKSKSQR